MAAEESGEPAVADEDDELMIATPASSNAASGLSSEGPGEVGPVGTSAPDRPAFAAPPRSSARPRTPQYVRDDAARRLTQRVSAAARDMDRGRSMAHPDLRQEELRREADPQQQLPARLPPGSSAARSRTPPPVEPPSPSAILAPAAELHQLGRAVTPRLHLARAGTPRSEVAAPQRPTTPPLTTLSRPESPACVTPSRRVPAVDFRRLPLRPTTPGDVPPTPPAAVVMQAAPPLDLSRPSTAPIPAATRPSTPLDAERAATPPLTLRARTPPPSEAPADLRRLPLQPNALTEAVSSALGPPARVRSRTPPPATPPHSAAIRARTPPPATPPLTPSAVRSRTPPPPPPPPAGATRSKTPPPATPPPPGALRPAGTPRVKEADVAEERASPAPPLPELPAHLPPQSAGTEASHGRRSALPPPPPPPPQPLSARTAGSSASALPPPPPPPVPKRRPSAAPSSADGRVVPKLPPPPPRGASASSTPAATSRTSASELPPPPPPPPPPKRAAPALPATPGGSQQAPPKLGPPPTPPPPPAPPRKGSEAPLEPASPGGSKLAPPPLPPSPLASSSTAEADVSADLVGSPAASASPSAPRASISPAWAAVLSKKKHLKTSDVHKVCNRFRELRNRSGRAITDHFLSLEELAEVLAIDVAETRPLFNLLVGDSGTFSVDFRVLLVALAGLTKAKTVDRMRFAALLIDDAGTNKLTQEQLVLVLRANSLLVSDSPPADDLEARAFELLCKAGAPDGSCISMDGFLELVRASPQEIYIDGVPPSAPSSACTSRVSSAAPSPRQIQTRADTSASDQQDLVVLLQAHGVPHLLEWLTREKGVSSLRGVSELSEDDLTGQGLKKIPARQLIKAAKATSEARKRKDELAAQALREREEEARKEEEATSAQAAEAEQQEREEEETKRRRLEEDIAERQRQAERRAEERRLEEERKEAARQRREQRLREEEERRQQEELDRQEQLRLEEERKQAEEVEEERRRAEQLRLRAELQRAEEQLVNKCRFAGRWVTGEDGDVVVVSKKAVTDLRTGEILATVVARDGDILTIEEDEELVCAKLEDGCLTWEDGDVWRRETAADSLDDGDRSLHEAACLHDMPAPPEEDQLHAAASGSDVPREPDEDDHLHAAASFSDVPAAPYERDQSLASAREPDEPAAPPQVDDELHHAACQQDDLPEPSVTSPTSASSSQPASRMSGSPTSVSSAERARLARSSIPKLDFSRLRAAAAAAEGLLPPPPVPPVPPVPPQAALWSSSSSDVALSEEESDDWNISADRWHKAEHQKQDQAGRAKQRQATRKKATFAFPEKEEHVLDAEQVDLEAGAAAEAEAEAEAETAELVGDSLKKRDKRPKSWSAWYDEDHDMTEWSLARFRLHEQKRAFFRVFRFGGGFEGGQRRLLLAGIAFLLASALLWAIDVWTATALPPVEDGPNAGLGTHMVLAARKVRSILEFFTLFAGAASLLYLVAIRHGVLSDDSGAELGAALASATVGRDYKELLRILREEKAARDELAKLKSAEEGEGDVDRVPVRRSGYGKNGRPLWYQKGERARRAELRRVQAASGGDGAVKLPIPLAGSEDSAGRPTGGARVKSRARVAPGIAGAGVGTL